MMSAEVTDGADTAVRGPGVGFREPDTAARAASQAARPAGEPGAQGARHRLPPDVVGVAVTCVDTAGITRVKGVPVRRLAEAAHAGVGLSPVFDVALVDDSFTSSARIGGPEGDLRMVPDLDALALLSPLPGWAWAPGDRFEQSGEPYAACHRSFARRMVERARERDVELVMGFETEWVVTRPASWGHEEAPPQAPFEGNAYGMTRLAPMSDYLREILTALESAGVEVQQIHPEYAPGQFEVTVAPADPLRAADLVVLVQEIVRAVTVRHGWEANFGPSVLAGQVGNGRHVHLSLWREGRNLCGGGSGVYGLTPEAESFLSGVLDELPALLAIGAPSPASYLRLGPSRWTGAFQCWGPENREAALRLVPGPQGSPRSANAEVKCFDAAASPYLVAGAVIAAGLAGMDTKGALPEPTRGDPAGRADGPPRLPENLPGAVARFRSSAVLREALGDALFEAVIAVREAESALFDGWSPQSIANATRRRY